MGNFCHVECHQPSLGSNPQPSDLKSNNKDIRESVVTCVFFHLHTSFSHPNKVAAGIINIAWKCQFRESSEEFSKYVYVWEEEAQNSECLVCDSFRQYGMVCWNMPWRNPSTTNPRNWINPYSLILCCLKGNIHHASYCFCVTNRNLSTKFSHFKSPFLS